MPRTLFAKTAWFCVACRILQVVDRRVYLVAGWLFSQTFVRSYFMATFKLTNFRVLSTGVDGGRYYISTEIEHNGATRQLTVLFKSKSDEKTLSNKMEINVTGNLIDEGLQQSLVLLDAKIIDGQ